MIENTDVGLLIKKMVQFGLKTNYNKIGKRTKQGC